MRMSLETLRAIIEMSPKHTLKGFLYQLADLEYDQLFRIKFLERIKAAELELPENNRELSDIYYKLKETAQNQLLQFLLSYQSYEPLQELADIYVNNVHNAVNEIDQEIFNGSTKDGYIKSKVNEYDLPQSKESIINKLSDGYYRLKEDSRTELNDFLSVVKNNMEILSNNNNINTKEKSVDVAIENTHEATNSILTNLLKPYGSQMPKPQKQLEKLTISESKAKIKHWDFFDKVGYFFKSVFTKGLPVEWKPDREIISEACTTLKVSDETPVNMPSLEFDKDTLQEKAKKAIDENKKARHEASQAIARNSDTLKKTEDLAKSVENKCKKTSEDIQTLTKEVEELTCKVNEAKKNIQDIQYEKQTNDNAANKNVTETSKKEKTKDKRLEKFLEPFMDKENFEKFSQKYKSTDTNREKLIYLNRKINAILENITTDDATSAKGFTKLNSGSPILSMKEDKRKEALSELEKLQNDIKNKFLKTNQKNNKGSAANDGNKLTFEKDSGRRYRRQEEIKLQ
jgi:hypothetical protein